MTLHNAARRPWRFSTRILLPVGLATLVMAALTGFGLFWSTDRSDRISVQRQIRTTEHAIKSSIDTVAHDQEVVAVWDDAVVKTQERDLAWIDENLGVWMHTLFGHDRVFVLGGIDEPIYAMGDGRQAPTATFDLVRREIQPLIDEVRGRVRVTHHAHDRPPGADPDSLPSRLRTTEKAVHASHFLRVENRPAVVSVMRIVPHTEELVQEPGREALLVNIRFMDRDFLNELEARNLIDGARYSASDDRENGEEALPLVTEFGDLIGYILWRPELPGTQILKVLAPLTAGAAALAVLIMGVLVSSLWRASKELRTALQDAQQASSAKSEFLASMSHEIRTPLNSIMGFTDLILDRQDLPSEVRRKLDLVKLSSTALLTVINDVLEFSKIEAGAVELNPRPFSPQALAKNCLSIVHDLAVRKGLTIDATTDGTMPDTLIGDEPRLRQILLNLLNNAIKFTPAGGIRLILHHEASSSAGEQLRFTVTDTGIGIPLDKQAHLFERFRQVDGSASRTYGGTGLGLAISKHLVETMGGTIGVESRLGEGATFWFSVTLPRGKAEAAEDERPQQQYRRSPGASVLLAEDVEINQEIAKAILEGAGYRVHVVSDGAQAVMAVRNQAFDVVLMDVQMPVMDGIAATRHIRALPEPACRIPIIAMTANVYAEQIASFVEAGMDDHVGKPFQRDDLFATLDRWTPQGSVATPALTAA